jgi:hypothetical protein
MGLILIYEHQTKILFASIYPGPVYHSILHGWPLYTSDLRYILFQ